ncbi:Uncharacterised protein [Vibrio cholerae]|nr:Uncharacterised protein [Vibrio cholerae]CSB31252.1 Uncharacterised protein [Vibrio cholerae]CSB74061.1 Uncharacterised protein [Vibrio cholerae]CSC33116.1 Uncharacterised protein [Vibrio cholerae]
MWLNLSPHRSPQFVARCPIQNQIHGGYQKPLAAPQDRETLPDQTVWLIPQEYRPHALPNPKRDHPVTDKKPSALKVASLCCSRKKPMIEQQHHKWPTGEVPSGTWLLPSPVAQLEECWLLRPVVFHTSPYNRPQVLRHSRTSNQSPSLQQTTSLTKIEKSDPLSRPVHLTEFCQTVK